RGHKGINLVVCFDEAHNVLPSKLLRRQIGVLIRERRHLRCTLVLSDQDLLKLEPELLALASLSIMHRGTGKDNLDHFIKANELWKKADRRKLGALPDGRAYILSKSGQFHRGSEHFIELPRLVSSAILRRCRSSI